MGCLLHQVTGTLNTKVANQTHTLTNVLIGSGLHQCSSPKFFRGGMGRNKNKTRSGRNLNPADAFRKQQRKKEKQKV